MSNLNPYQNIQSVLSIGYIYLIIMGILNEFLFYKQLGIDILSYSSILDVLISPIAQITSSYSSIILITVLILLVLFLPKYLAKNRDASWVKKAFTIDEKHTTKETENTFLERFLFLLSLGLFGFFVGTGNGDGLKLNKKLENNEIEYNDQLHFVSGETANIEIIGKNSNYIFYLTEGKNNVIVTPINGVVKSIEEVK